MTQPQHHDRHLDDRRNRMTRAAITGLLAGTTRALVSWLLDHLTGC